MVVATVYHRIRQTRHNITITSEHEGGSSLLIASAVSYIAVSYRAVLVVHRTTQTCC